jgi:hypothetical protein
MTGQPTEEPSGGPYMMCSSCYTPCLVSEGHVIPGWNVNLSRILTSYRCANCWLDGIEKTRAVVTTGSEEVFASFADFLDVQGYTETSGKLRRLSPERQQEVILGILNLLVNGEEIFHP